MLSEAGKAKLAEAELLQFHKSLLQTSGRDPLCSWVREEADMDQTVTES